MHRVLGSITGSEFIWLDGSATLRLMFKRCKVELASIAGAHAPVRVPTSFVTTRRLRDEAVQAVIPLHVSQLWDHPRNAKGPLLAERPSALVPSVVSRRGP